MKLFTGWVMSAGLVLSAASANAQISAPYDARPLYSSVSDFDGPYAAMPREAPGYEAPGYYGPRLLPAPEVYTVLRDNGFSPLGVPQQRGVFYIIAVLARGGAEGRLVIDARDGRIVRFVPGYRTGSNFNADMAVGYGPLGVPPVSAVRGPPRPPASVPYVASRTPSVPLPRAMPERSDAPQTVGKAAEPAKEAVKEAVKEPAKVEPAKPSEPAPQSVAQAKPAAVPATPPAVIEAKPAPQILPTREMPKVQGLE
jgi:hypothetical protein